MTHTYLHENLTSLLKIFRYDAHPMGMVISSLAALSTFYPEANPALQVISMKMKNRHSDWMTDWLVSRELTSSRTIKFATSRSIVSVSSLHTFYDLRLSLLYSSSRLFKADLNHSLTNANHCSIQSESFLLSQRVHTVIALEELITNLRVISPIARTFSTCSTDWTKRTSDPTQSSLELLTSYSSSMQITSSTAPPRPWDRSHPQVPFRLKFIVWTHCMILTHGCLCN